MDVLQAVWSAFKESWELLLLFATWLGIGLMAAQRRRDWASHRFSERVNFSLNLLEDDAAGGRRLLLRTLLEDSAANVWLNEYGVMLVQRAAQGTTIERPFLRIEPRRDLELVKHAVLNVLSERFSDAFVAQGLGLPVARGRFLFGITWERYGDMRTQKLRVLLISPVLLAELFGGPSEPELRLSAESHRNRIATLREMHRLLHSADEQERALIAEVELGVVLATGHPVGQDKMAHSSPTRECS
jgi:hypothetical protein